MYVGGGGRTFRGRRPESTQTFEEGPGGVARKIWKKKTRGFYAPVCRGQRAKQ